jgi:hypothetical protein
VTDAATPGTTSLTSTLGGTPQAPPGAAPPASTPGTTPPAAPPAAVDGKPPAEAKPPDAKPPDAPAPAELDFKLPEGFKPDAAALDTFRALAKETGLDGPKAQKLVEFYASQHQAQQKALEDSFATQQKAWVDELTADKEWGGANLSKTATLAQQAVLKFGGPELAKKLDSMGLGDHPDLVRAFARIGKAMADDSTLGTTAGAPASASQSQEAFLRQLYSKSPEMFSKKE